MGESCLICSSCYFFFFFWRFESFQEKKSTLKTSWANISLQNLVWSLKVHLKNLIIEIQTIWNLKGHLIKSSVCYFPLPLYAWAHTSSHKEGRHRNTHTQRPASPHTQTHTPSLLKTPKKKNFTSLTTSDLYTSSILSWLFPNKLGL